MNRRAPQPSSVYRPLAAARQRQLQGYRFAPFRARAGAILLDGVLVGVVVALVELSIQPVRTPTTGELTLSIEFGGLATLAATVLYFGVMNRFWGGRTVGKRLMNIRVIGVAEDALSFSRSMQRALAYSVSAATAGLGFLQYFRHPNRQTLHDRIAETLVVVDA